MLKTTLATSPIADARPTTLRAVKRRASANRSDLTRSLFIDYAAETSVTSRQDIADHIIEINMCVAAAIANRYRDRGELIEDLQQVAYMGLVKAVAGFDASRGRDFLAYAAPTIAGEVKRHFRDRCWVIRPTRRIQELKSQVAGCTEMLGQSLGHPPRADEIADYLDAPVGEVNEALRADSCFRPASLDVKVGESRSSSRGDLIGDVEADFERVETRSMLGPLIFKLSIEDQQIIAHRFVEQWTQEQIAQDIGVSQMQVSRRLARIMRTLRDDLDEGHRSAS